MMNNQWKWGIGHRTTGHWLHFGVVWFESMKVPKMCSIGTVKWEWASSVNTIIPTFYILLVLQPTEKWWITAQIVPSAHTVSHFSLETL